jgi:hypothetical protein
MKEQALKVLVSQIVAATSNDIWDPQTLTDWSCFQQGNARWNRMYIEQLKMSNVIDTYHESIVSSPKLQMTLGNFFECLNKY